MKCKRGKKRPSGSTCLTVQLDFGKEISLELTQLQFEAIIRKCIEVFHGQLSAAIDIDIISYSNCLAELSIPTRLLVNFWSALTLYRDLSGLRCRFIVTPKDTTKIPEMS